MRTLLVTGASGFVGRYFVLDAVRRGFEITAVGRGTAPDWLPNQVRWIIADLSNPKGLSGLPRQYWGVAHFANMSVPADYKSDDVLASSIAMTTHLVAHISSARVIFPSSCHVYSAGCDRKVEDGPTAPAGLYGQAKILSEKLLLSARHLDTRIARPFNHIGKHMPRDLMLPSLAARVKEANVHEPIIMKGKNSLRDFTDVRDIVCGYINLLELNDPSERIFNICSGGGIRIRELAERLLALAGKDNPVLFEDEAQSIDDIDQLVGDPSRMFAITGWKPRFSLDDSLRSILVGGR